MAKEIWKDRKRTIFGLPLSFTKYSLTEEKLIIQTGFFNTKQEEVRLYRILDVSLSRSFGQKLFGLGTIHCCSADKTTPEFDVKNIKNSKNILELLSDTIEIERNKKRISGREIISHIEDDDDEIDNDEHNV